MRILVLAVCLAGLAIPLLAQPPYHLDKSQGEPALRLIRVGETVRLYCKPCTDVVYSNLAIESRTVEPLGRRYRLHLNGEDADVSNVYVDSGFDDGWENLAVLLGFKAEGLAVKLPPALDEDTRLAPHAGTYSGTIGTTEVRLELTLDGRKLPGSYAPAAGGPAVRITGTAYNATRKSEILTLVERSQMDDLTATLRGQLDAESGTFSGTRTPLDGSPAEPFQLTRSGAESRPGDSR